MLFFLLHATGDLYLSPDMGARLSCSWTSSHSPFRTPHLRRETRCNFIALALLPMLGDPGAGESTGYSFLPWPSQSLCCCLAGIIRGIRVLDAESFGHGWSYLPLTPFPVYWFPVVFKHLASKQSVCPIQELCLSTLSKLSEFETCD